MSRKQIVRLQFQRIIGGVFLLIALVLFLVVSAGKGVGDTKSFISKDVSGVFVFVALGLWMLLSKNYLFFTGDDWEE